MYLDNAATSFPKPEKVYDAVQYVMRQVGASPGRGGYRRSLEAGRLLFQAREKVASFFAIPDSSGIVFTHNATSALNLALHGTLVSGDHVVTTAMEHNSVLRPLYALQKRGVDMTVASADEEGVVPLEAIVRSVRKNTRMVVLGHVSNVCGAIQNVGAVSEFCRAHGILLLVDAAQSAGHIPVNVSQLGIDMMAVPGHKGLLGPSGTGFLYVSPGVSLSSVIQGGTGTASTLLDQPLVMPDGFEAGTLNLPGIAGLQAGVEFLLEIGIDAVQEHEQVLLQQARSSLEKLQGVKVYGPVHDSERCSVLSFTVQGVDPGILAAELDRNFDIAVRSGLQCAPLAHKSLGTAPGGTVRMSPGWFNTSEEIALFSDAVVQCVNTITASA